MREPGGRPRGRSAAGAHPAVPKPGPATGSAWTKGGPSTPRPPARGSRPSSARRLCRCVGAPGSAAPRPHATRLPPSRRPEAPSRSRGPSCRRGVRREPSAAPGQARCAAPLLVASDPIGQRSASRRRRTLRSSPTGRRSSIPPAGSNASPVGDPHLQCPLALLDLQDHRPVSKAKSVRDGTPAPSQAPTVPEPPWPERPPPSGPRTRTATTGRPRPPGPPTQAVPTRPPPDPSSVCILNGNNARFDRRRLLRLPPGLDVTRIAPQELPGAHTPTVAHRSPPPRLPATAPLPGAAVPATPIPSLGRRTGIRRKPSPVPGKKPRITPYKCTD